VATQGTSKRRSDSEMFGLLHALEKSGNHPDSVAPVVRRRIPANATKEDGIAFRSQKQCIEAQERLLRETKHSVGHLNRALKYFLEEETIDMLRMRPDFDPNRDPDRAMRILREEAEKDPPRCLTVAALETGAMMENAVQIFDELGKQMVGFRGTLEELLDQVTDLTQVINPQIVNHIQNIRTLRQTVVTELQQALTAMRDVRKFFLESDYAKEMERLERFMATCRQLQELKQSGVLDAVCDTAIRLGIGEETHNEGTSIKTRTGNK
jgi:hypothetical protein